MKQQHEIRDPIHAFIYIDNDERKVVDSRPFQRLRYIHQLALSYLVYPGTTHRRFEHSLGVMELAGQVFDIVTNPQNFTIGLTHRLKQLGSLDELRYWRKVLRIAALCHDIGHLPFSHAAESELLPQGWDHERLTRELIKSEHLMGLWNEMTPPLRPLDIEKLAVGPDKAPDLEFSEWESILSEIIVGDSFGVDRMDYLLRDSYHAGVTYGKFDYHRLIQTIRILSQESVESSSQKKSELGIEQGGIYAAEALALARYFIYSQVYLHPIRRIYDIHLTDFLKDWLDGGEFSTDLETHLRMTGNQVVSALMDAAASPNRLGHRHAKRIVNRQHYKPVFENTLASDLPDRLAGELAHFYLCQQFPQDSFRRDYYSQESGPSDFPVMLRDGKIVRSLAVSQTLDQIPSVLVDVIFADSEIRNKAKTSLASISLEQMRHLQEKQLRGEISS